MSFKLWYYLAESNGHSGLQSFVHDGRLTLWHYTPDQGQEVLLSPNQFGRNSFTLGDRKVSQLPRIFFYLDPHERESFFTSAALYLCSVPANRVYDLITDPAGIKDAIRRENYGVLDVSELLDRAYRMPEIDGVYYNPGMHVVCMFTPVKVRKAEEKDVPVDLRSSLKRAS